VDTATVIWLGKHNGRHL